MIDGSFTNTPILSPTRRLYEPEAITPLPRLSKNLGNLKFTEFIDHSSDKVHVRILVASAGAVFILILNEEKEEKNESIG